MAATNFTPISIYHTSTPGLQPDSANLTAGELALNIPDGKLYFKDDSSNIVLLASKTASSNVTSVSLVTTNGFGGSIANPTTTPAITLTTTATGMLKGSSGALIAASPGVDFAVPPTGSFILYGDGSGGFSNVTVGSGLSFTGGTLASTSGGGSVTTVSLVAANGFSGSVANPSSTPAITLSTSITGIIKGSAGALTAAVSGTDYAPATSGSSILYGNGSGGFSNVTVGSGLNFSGGTLSSTGGSGTVTSVTMNTGLTGITVSGLTTQTITSSGTFTIGGTLALTNGGTGATTAATARTNLGVTATGSDTTYCYRANNLSDLSSASTARTNLGLGTMATQATTSYNTISGTNSWSGPNTFVATPSTTLTGAVNISQGGAAAPTLYLYNATGGDAERGGEIKMVNFNAASGVRNKYIRVAQNGQFQIIDSAYTGYLLTLDNSSNFAVSGSITTSGGDGFKPGGGSWSVYSDARLKTDSTPLTGALDKIAQLNPVTYKWKYDTTEITTGFIAQEVKVVMPTAVGEVEPLDIQKPFVPEGEKVMSIGWKNDMIAYLVGAIKELKAEVDALKAAK